ncbi:MAG: pyridoxamine 5'-phosphate oxidase family protein [Candidatus Heimdallarchaeota archaeon]|nr:MAG: pyridoxamine 5'-phosphate oxidase family protein [Candidatus Heimdallarchaeota archaeon]
MITPEIEEYLEHARIPLRLSVVTESGWPIILSLWFTYTTDGKFFLATPAQAKVVGLLEKNPRCAFEVSNENPPYCGIRGQAEAKIIRSKGIEVLETLLQRYITEGKGSPLGKRLISRKIQEVAIELTPTKIFTWNFENRMKDSTAIKPQFICP